MSSILHRAVEKELRDTSVVYLLELPELERAPHSFVGYWEAEVDGEDEILEGGPGWDDAEAAVAWGRQRASVVVLSHEDGLVEIFDARTTNRMA